MTFDAIVSKDHEERVVRSRFVLNTGYAKFFLNIPTTSNAAVGWDWNGNTRQQELRALEAAELVWLDGNPKSPTFNFYGLTKDGSQIAMRYKTLRDYLVQGVPINFDVFSLLVDLEEWTNVFESVCIAITNVKLGE